MTRGQGSGGEGLLLRPRRLSGPGKDGGGRGQAGCEGSAVPKVKNVTSIVSADERAQAVCMCVHVCAHEVWEKVEGRRAGGGASKTLPSICSAWLHRSSSFPTGRLGGRVCLEELSWVLLEQSLRNRQSLLCTKQPLGLALSAPRGFPRSCTSPGLGGKATRPPCQPMPGLWRRPAAA